MAGASQPVKPGEAEPAAASLRKREGEGRGAVTSSRGEQGAAGQLHG